MRALRILAAVLSIALAVLVAGCSSFPGVDVPSETTPEIVTPSPDHPSGIGGRQLCYILDFSRTDDGYLATLDFIVWLTGDEAQAQAGGEPPNGFYILNENKRRWVFPVESDVRVSLLESAQPTQPVTLDGFQALLAGERSVSRESQPYWVTIVDDTIVAIEEQYVP